MRNGYLYDPGRKLVGGHITWCINPLNQYRQIPKWAETVEIIQSRPSKHVETLFEIALDPRSVRVERVEQSDGLSEIKR